MKITNLMLCAVVAGAMVLTAGKANALQPPPTSLPLKLTSVSGTMNVTANFNGKNTTTPYTKVSFNYNSLMVIIANQVKLDSGIIVPKNVELIFDPISGDTYLTNNLGFYYDLYRIAYVDIYEMATSFKGDFYAGSENDVIGVELDIYGYGPDGQYYEAEMYGSGNLNASYSGKLFAIATGTSQVKMTVSLKNGSGYAEYQSSDDGVVTDGQFTFSGSGTVPSYVFPYAYYWWD